MILAIILTLAFLLIPFPQQQKLKGVAKPLAEYHLVSTGVGSFATTLVDHWTDQKISSLSISSERGGLMNYRAGMRPSADAQIKMGDTLGWISSSQVESETARLEGNIATLKASLALERSGSRQSEIEGARLRLAFARTRYEERRKILERSADLLNRNIISQQEYDDDESRERLDSIRISIAEADLASALSGAQTAKLEVIKTRIADETNKLGLQLELLNALTLISPIAGQIHYPMTEDTLWSVQKTDTLLVLIPMNSKDMNVGQFRSELMLQTPEAELLIPAEEIRISQQIYSLGSDQMMLLKIKLANPGGTLRPGQRFDITLKEVSQSVLSLVMELF